VLCQTEGLLKDYSYAYTCAAGFVVTERTGGAATPKNRGKGTGDPPKQGHRTAARQGTVPLF
jgi:hypothetical protein